MKRSYSSISLIFAIVIHVLIMAIMYILFLLEPKQDEKAATGQKFRISLKEYKPSRMETALPTAAVQPISKSLPKPIQNTPKTSMPKTTNQPAPIQTPIQKSTTQPIPFKQAPIPLPMPAQEPARPAPSPKPSPTPRRESGLYDILSRPDGSAQEIHKSTSSKITESMQKMYGDKFNELSKGEQQYILDNQEAMRRITQGVLDRYAPARIPNNVRVEDVNMVEFYLHPDGSISDLHIIKSSRHSILDATTRETIELAYAKYPRPQQKTLIRYRVWYNIN